MAKHGWHRLGALLSLSAPRRVRNQLILTQYERVEEAIPVLYFTVAIMSLGGAVAAQGDFPILYKAIMPTLLVGVSVGRYLIWRSRKDQPVPVWKAQRYLRGTLVMAAAISFAASMWAISSYYETTEPRRVLAGFFMTLSSLAVASCLASHPRAAIAVVVMGLTPVALAMLTTPDPGIQSAGMCMVIVALLQFHLLLSNYREMVTTLVLQHDMEQLAHTDPLTGLANRRVFTAKLAAEIENPEPGRISIAMLDLNGFKPANDRYGHAVGDEILVELAKRLKTLCRNSLSIARLGGDEFAILFPRNFGDELVRDHVAAVRAICALPYAASVHVTNISVSIGTASFPDHGESVSDLLHEADRALYAEKAERRSPSRKSARR